MDTTDKYGAGFVVIPRITFEHFIDEVLYNYLMKGANYKASSECQRGQMIVSVRKLPEVMGWTYQQIRTSLDRLSSNHLIKMEQIKYKGNKASLITIVNYDGFQQLENYSKINAPNSAPNNANRTAVKQQDKQQDKQQVKHIKESCRNRQDITSFVDSQQLLNRIELPNRLFVEYFDLVRLQRKSGKIANSVLEGLWGRLAKHAIDSKQTAEANQAIVTYALSTYIVDYGHKPAEYAFGIIRNTSEPEARQGLIRLQNMKEDKSSRGDKYDPSRGGARRKVPGVAKKNGDQFAHLNINSVPVLKVQGFRWEDVQ
ncbi:hypothetical protein [Brevibacillus laterosporus]|uniref:hypothetical protein n=1 Tax=Brevibacillus laterosporus TaxID=1465 RepID=UPI002655EE2F|nr:hypothetical protein [Brevibacillus laterosporus]MDN9012806.1 hypothetical protein [Brevibacillus laterosporus]MDO0943897.1 hypothetical protein [Brevibacillus laterosporus]